MKLEASIAVLIIAEIAGLDITILSPTSEIKELIVKPKLIRF